MAQAGLRKAVFPGSFDPFTLGHQQIVDQALEVFDRVLIAVGKSGSKQALLETSIRLEALRETYAAEPRVEIHSFSGLVVEFARQVQAQSLIRGLRSEADLAYELPMAHMNRSLVPQVQTLFFPTAADKAYISSTLVREIARNNGNFSTFVPPAFARVMREALASGR